MKRVITTRSLLRFTCLGFACLGLLLLMPDLTSRADEASQSGESSRSEGANSMTEVLSYNIRYASPGDGPDRWQFRVDAVADVIGSSDVAALQEVTHGQLEDLIARLDGFGWYGVGREDGKQAGEAVPIFYRESRFKKLDEGTFWLSDTPSVAGTRGWDAALPRITSWVKLQDKQNQQPLMVASTHFDHLGQQARLESAKLLRQWMLDLPAELPVIVLGDFNTRPGSDPYTVMVGDQPSTSPIRDARSISDSEPSGPQSTWNGFDKVVPGQIIDHVFVRGNIDVKRYAVENPKTSEDRFTSDHLPVRVVVTYGDAAAN